MAMFSPRRLTWSRVLTSVLLATSLNMHEVPSSVWSHLTAHSSCGQLTDEEVGLFVHHCLSVHPLYALLGSVTSYVDVVGVLRAQFRTRQLAHESPCFPLNEGQGLVELVSPKWGGVEFFVQ